MDKSLEKILLEIKSQIAPDRVSHEQALILMDRVLARVAAYREEVAKDGETYATHADTRERERIITEVAREHRYGQRNAAIEKAIQQAKNQGLLR